MPCDKFQDKIFDLLACVHYSWGRSSHRICNSESLNHQKWWQSTYLVHQHQNGWLWAFFVGAIPDAKLGLNGHRWPWSRCLPRLVASVKISLWYVQVCISWNMADPKSHCTVINRTLCCATLTGLVPTEAWTDSLAVAASNRSKSLASYFRWLPDVWTIRWAVFEDKTVWWAHRRWLLCLWRWWLAQRLRNKLREC